MTEEIMTREEALVHIRRHLADDQLKIREGDALDDLGLDSLELLDLMQAFDVPDEDVPNIRTIGDLVDHLSA